MDSARAGKWGQDEGGQSSPWIPGAPLALPTPSPQGSLGRVESRLQEGILQQLHLVPELLFLFSMGKKYAREEVRAELPKELN